MVRTKLAAGLRAASPTGAKLVERADTRLTVVATPWLTGWQVVDVLNLAPPHPQRFYAALSADGTVRVLTGEPDEFSHVATEAGLRVASASVAVAVATTFLDSTQDFVRASYRVDRIEDVQWLSQRTAAQEKRRRAIIADYGDQVGRAEAERSGTGWRASVWMVYDHRLDRHRVTIAADGAVTDRAETVVDGLPVADSY